MTLTEIMDELKKVIQKEYDSTSRMRNRAIAHGCSTALTNDMLEEINWIYNNIAYPGRVMEHTFKYAFQERR